MIDVLGLGSVALDDILLVEAWPEADAKVRVISRTSRLGGLTGHALVAAAKAGARCAYAGRLGLDHDSETTGRALAEAGIDLAAAAYGQEHGVVRSVIISAKQGGTRNVFSHATGLTGAHEDLPTENVIRDASVVLVDHHGIDGSIRAAKLAKAIVADFERDDHPRFAELLALVDHLILGAAFAQRITGASSPGDAAQRLWRSTRQVVIITAGAEGCWWVSDSEMQPQHHPAVRVETHDTSGCGDVFHGTYAAQLAAGAPLAERIRAATAAASLHASMVR